MNTASGVSGAWVPRPRFPGRAQPLLREGRQALQGGARAEGLALLRAACALDPVTYCKPWGLMPLLEAEGRAGLRPRMLERLQSWYRKPKSRIHAHVAELTQKPQMRRYIAELGLPLPQLLAEAEDLAVLDWQELPADLVLKPQNAASSQGVIVAAQGQDHMARAPLAGGLPAYARDLYRGSFDGAPVPVLVEELLVDVAAAQDPALVIPRDFKVFAVAGQVGFVRVHDRNAPDGKRSLATLDRAGNRLPAAQRHWPEAPGDAPLPAGFEVLIAMAEHLSSRLPWLLRLDFYLTPKGPVFGEFTTFPNAGLDYTPFGRRTMLQMWEIWPD